MGLVLLSLLSLTSIYRPRPIDSGEHHAAKSQPAPVNQRNLQSTDFQTAVPATVYVPLPAPSDLSLSLQADRIVVPRRLPGSYYYRPPPFVS